VLEQGRLGLVARHQPDLFLEVVLLVPRCLAPEQHEAALLLVVAEAVAVARGQGRLLLLQVPSLGLVVLEVG